LALQALRPYLLLLLVLGLIPLLTTLAYRFWAKKPQE
jgi:hypothetical protein